jgi:hypothetical protein
MEEIYIINSSSQNIGLENYSGKAQNLAFYSHSLAMDYLKEMDKFFTSVFQNKDRFQREIKGWNITYSFIDVDKYKSSALYSILEREQLCRLSIYLEKVELFDKWPENNLSCFSVKYFEKLTDVAIKEIENE